MLQSIFYGFFQRCIQIIPHKGKDFKIFKQFCSLTIRKPYNKNIVFTKTNESFSNSIQYILEKHVSALFESSKKLPQRKSFGRFKQKCVYTL